MPQAVQNIFAEWELPIWLTLSIVVTAAVYLRGWFAIRKTRPQLFTLTRLLCFMTGLATLWLSLGSPLDGFADASLSAHMVEHLLLMSAVPPLLLLGLPVVPLLRGLPEVFRYFIAGPLLRLPCLRKLGHSLVTPAIAWVAMNLSFLAWHIPRAYDAALQNNTIHELEHLCFLGTSLMFWWCILWPWPAQPHRRNWGVLIYLMSADVINTLLSAFLAFCDRPVYAFYVQHPSPFNITPLEDQVLGASIMWVIGSLAFLIPAMVITVRLLRPAQFKRA